jgi:putative transposase
MSYTPERYLLHDFVVMPDHFHAVLTPKASLELAVQCIKGGFSFRVKRELAWKDDVWTAGFSDHRIRDDHDYEVHRQYIARNPVKAGLADHERDYPYSSVSGRYVMDTYPRGLKPTSEQTSIGAAQAAPFQNECDTSHKQGIRD